MTFGSWSLQITRYCCTRGIGNSDASRHIFQRKLLWYCNMDMRMCVVILNYCPNWKCENSVIRMNWIWVISMWGMGDPLWALYFRSVLLWRLLKKNGSKESEMVLFGIFAFCCSYNTDGSVFCMTWLMFGVVMLFSRCRMWLVAWTLFEIDCGSNSRCFLDSCQVWW